MLRVLASHPGIAGQDHGLLAGLLDDDHPQHPHLLGRNPPQLLYGGTLAGQTFTIRGNLADLGGPVRVDSRLGVNATPLTSDRLRVVENATITGARNLGVLLGSPTLGADTASYRQLLVSGLVNLNGFNLTFLRGIDFVAALAATGTETLGTWEAASFLLNVPLQGPSVTTARALHASGINLPFLAGLGTIYGLHVRDLSAGLGEVAYGVAIDDFLGSLGVPNLFEAGPGTPYARLIGGADPGVEQTNLYLKEQTTLRRVQWKDPGAAGVNLLATDRVMVLV